jgi:hypothetical protein
MDKCFGRTEAFIEEIGKEICKMERVSYLMEIQNT